MSIRSLSMVATCVAAAHFLQPATAAVRNTWEVSSPDGRVAFVVTPAEAEPGGSRLVNYRVEIGEPGSRRVLLEDSPLGLRLVGADLSRGLRLEGRPEYKEANDSYSLLYGKKSRCEVRGRQMTLRFRTETEDRLDLEVRAFTDGVAFRYRIPGDDVRTLEAETTGFRLPSGSKVWCAPSDKPTMYAPAYETYYEREFPAGAPSPLGLGWSYPMLFRTGDGSGWGLITEANLGPGFCGTRLSHAATDGTYSVALPTEAEGNGTGSIMPSAKLPWEMPWRVIIAGQSLGTIVESTMVTDVSEPSQITDTSWIRPGRVAWSWWSDNPSPKSALAQKRFIDLAAEMGWEFVLVDANWTIMEVGNFREVLDHAKAKGVGVLLWYNSGGPHNMVTEKPRDCFTYPSVRGFELDLLREWGVKGVKVDFFQSDKQDVIGLYHGILRDSATKHIMVNFHGCTLPRGWERTYPHLMSMEAVRGAECYIFDGDYPKQAPVQNTILPFTRNAVGPMDYTPVTFSNNRHPHRTTAAHELALSVVFTSGWLHLADRVEAYQDLPPIPKQFLKNVPVSWDETRFIDGYPGKFVVIARRKGGDWYVAGINGEESPRTVKVDRRGWGESAKYRIAIEDGDDPTGFSVKTHGLEPAESPAARMAPRGGFAWILKQ